MTSRLNKPINIPSHVFYLQDEDEPDHGVDAPDIPTVLEYGYMLQEPKADVEDTEFETFDQYINAEFMIKTIMERQRWRE